MQEYYDIITTEYRKRCRMELNGKRVLTIVSPDYDDLELWYPIIRLREAGAHVDIAVSMRIQRIKGSMDYQ
ncbi:hypothetical protein MGH68_14165 [Erysipelothrix sp. D19-032]